MPPKKGKGSSSSGGDLHKHLDNVKKDIKELKEKISKTNRAELTKVSYDASKAISDTASEIVKHSSELLDKAFKVLGGAIEGGKKALEEERKAEMKASATKARTTARKKTTAKKSTARKTTARSTAAKRTTTKK